jgi:hypothetical protein
LVDRDEREQRTCRVCGRVWSGHEVIVAGQLGCTMGTATRPSPTTHRLGVRRHPLSTFGGLVLGRVSSLVARRGRRPSAACAARSPRSGLPLIQYRRIQQINEPAGP